MEMHPGIADAVPGRFFAGGPSVFLGGAADQMAEMEKSTDSGTVFLDNFLGNGHNAIC